MNKTYSSRRVFLEKSLLSGAGLVLAATGCTPGAVSQPDEKSPTPKVTENTPTQVPTAQATATATETPQITPTYNVEDAGGSFTAAQEKLNNSPEAEIQKSIIESWLNNYWAKFDKPPFALGSQELKWKYIYNDASNPTEVMVLIEALGDYEGRTFTVPIADGKFVAVPPPEPQKGAEIKAGFGPLELSGGDEGLWLSVEKNIPVRRDKDKKVVERLNMESRQWEAVDKYPIDLEKLHNIPKSYSELLNHKKNYVQSPDPLRETEEFKEWFDVRLREIIGKCEEREMNYLGTPCSSLPPSIEVQSREDPHSFVGEPKFFYFQHGEIVHPVFVFNTYCDIQGKRYFNRTIAPALYDGIPAPQGIQSMNGLRQKKITTIGVIYTKADVYPDFVNEAIDAGLVYKDSFDHEQVVFGFGYVKTEP